MSIQTFYGNLDEQRNGAAYLTVAAGKVKVGSSIDMTASEIATLSTFHDIRAGVVTRDFSTAGKPFVHKV